MFNKAKAASDFRASYFSLSFLLKRFHVDTAAIWVEPKPGSGMRSRRRQSGQVIVLATLSLVAFLGMVGLALDVGYLWATRRSMQTAADAAAIAGAEALSVSGASVATVATTVAKQNGFSTANGSTITVSNPPVDGTYAGNANYVEVKISQTEPTFFLKVLGVNGATVTTGMTWGPATGAVAGNTNPPNNIIALNATAANAISIPSTVNMSCSGVAANSTSSSAIYVNGGNLTAASIGSVGGCNHAGGTVSVTPKTGIAPVKDPLSSISCPSANSCTRTHHQYTGTCEINSTQTCSPAVYSGTSETCGWGVSSPSTYNSHTHTYTYTPITVTFSGGTYGNYINIGGDSNHVCSGLTCNFNPGQFQCDSSGNYPSLQIGTYASGCTINCNSGSGSYTFVGPVQICGTNTCTLQPGTYCGGISIQGGSSSGPAVTFAPGNYYIGGGGLSCTGTCSLTTPSSGGGCHFYNTKDPSTMDFSPAPFNIGPNSTDNVTCSLFAPTSGSCEGCLFHQDSSIASSAHNCCIQTNSSSHCDGAIYCPGAALTYCGNSSSTGYTQIVADTITLGKSSTINNVHCNYSSLAHGSPIKSHGLYE